MDLPNDADFNRHGSVVPGVPRDQKRVVGKCRSGLRTSETVAKCFVYPAVPARHVATPFLLLAFCTVHTRRALGV